MKKILCNYTNPTDPTSFYRGVGPFTMLRRLDPNIEVHRMKDYEKPSWDFLSEFDMVFLQRPQRDDQEALINQARQLKIPIWIDFDDQTLCVPVENPYHEVYASNEVQVRIRYCLGMADIVTVTNQDLANAYAPYNKNIRVIRNAWDDYRFPVYQIQYRNLSKTFIWRGSNSHVRDLADSHGHLLAIAEKYPDWSWRFMGLRDHRLITDLSKVSKNVQYVPGLNLFSYFDKIREFDCGIQLVPLVDCEFNWCKSNIAFLEGTYSGNLVIGPNWKEWSGCVGRYEKLYDLPGIVSGAMHHMDPESGWNVQMQSLKEQLLSNINTQRLAIINEYVRH